MYDVYMYAWAEGVGGAEGFDSSSSSLLDCAFFFFFFFFLPSSSLSLKMGIASTCRNRITQRIGLTRSL